MPNIGPEVNDPSYIHVAVALIVGDDGRILVARRHDHAEQGGLWEFPGGKVEPGETVVQALARELNEELGIDLVQAQPLLRLRHRYPRRDVLLDVWRVTAFTGVPHGREGQPLRWLAPEGLSVAEFPAANKAIIMAARLPDSYLITPEPAGTPTQFLDSLASALERGVRLVQLRAKQSSHHALQALASDALRLCHSYGARLLINAECELVQTLVADGVHLTSDQLMGLTQRPLPENFLVAASCHDAAQVAQANQLGVDFIVIAPVLPTASHLGQASLGWERFAELVEGANMPVYALGGMKREYVEMAQRQGAQGIAAIRALWAD